MVSTTWAVAGPLVAAQWINRCGVHSAWCQDTFPKVASNLSFT
jgi:hypothetical protein